jgi:hypothetical protein
MLGEVADSEPIETSSVRIAAASSDPMRRSIRQLRAGERLASFELATPIFEHEFEYKVKPGRIRSGRGHATTGPNAATHRRHWQRPKNPE